MQGEMFMKKLPSRVILNFGEIKRIGILSEFCKSECFSEDGILRLATDDMMFSLDSSILPKDYTYEVPKGYVIKGFNN
jgi:hypothetical protein